MQTFRNIIRKSCIFLIRLKIGIVKSFAVFLNNEIEFHSALTILKSLSLGRTFSGTQMAAS